MKKLLFAIVVITIVSCEKSKPIEYTLFSGTIKNANSNILSIKNSRNEKIREIKVSDIGQFSDTIFNANGYFVFSDGTESSEMYLKDGYNIQLDMDAKEFDETIVYTGNGSVTNNILAQKIIIKEKDGTQKEVYALDETAFLSLMNQRKENLEKALDAVSDTDFVKQEKVNIHYNTINSITKYEHYHAYYIKNKDFKTSESFPDVLKDVTYDNEEYFKFSNPYRILVINNFHTTVKEKAEKEDIPYVEAALDLIKQSKSETINNSLLKIYSREVSARNANVEEIYTEIMALSTDENFKEGLTKQYNNVQKVAKGKPSPLFVNYENNAGGTTSLADLKGKYVYIDIWATWCGPCKAEIPFLKKVEKKYHGKNIEFVSISVDVPKAHGKWKQMIKDEQLGGIQLIADKGSKSKFYTEYGIRGIPRFILIDPAGNIVSSDAPRPSDEKLIDLFNELKI